MKIVYIILNHNFIGGIESITALKANYLVNNNYEVYIISPKACDDKPFFFFDKRIKIIPLNIDITKNKLLYHTMLTDILNDIKPQITIATTLELGKDLYKINDGSKKILELHFTKYKGKVKLANLQSVPILNILSHIYMYRRSQEVKKYDCTVVLTEEDYNLWSNTKSNLVVIPNFIEPLETKEIDYSKKQIIGLGRYTGQKGWEYLIQAWAIIASKYPDWHIAIFGKGNRKDRLQKLIKKYNIENSFKLMEPTCNISNEFQNSSIFAMTSRYEGLPLALTEAMNHGLAPVSFLFRSGPKELVIDGQTGFLIKQFDVKGFANALSKLMDDEDLRRKIGNAAKKDIRLRLDKELIMAKWMNLFNSLNDK